MVQVTVTDQGPGVPAIDADRIFNKHEQGETHRTRGAGLGLAISNRIVEQHGGQIGLQNGIESGTTFLVRLKSAGVENISTKQTSFAPLSSSCVLPLSTHLASC